MTQQTDNAPIQENLPPENVETLNSFAKYLNKNKFVFLALSLLALGSMGMFVTKSYTQKEPIQTETQSIELPEKAENGNGFSSLLETPVKEDFTCNADLQKRETELENRVVTVCEALANHDSEALYMSLSPGIREFFPKDSFLETEQQAKVDMGEVINVTITKPVEIRTDGEFNGEFADAYFKIQRTSQTNTYLTRFFLEDGSWWLLGTEDTDNF